MRCCNRLEGESGRNRRAVRVLTRETQRCFERNEFVFARCIPKLNTQDQGFGGFQVSMWEELQSLISYLVII